MDYLRGKRKKGEKRTKLKGRKEEGKEKKREEKDGKYPYFVFLFN